MLAFRALIVVGFYSINFTSLGTITLSLESNPPIQGRVMARGSVALPDTTPIGGPLIGAIGEHAGPRWGLAVGGVVARVAAMLGLGAPRQSRIAGQPPVRELLTSSSAESDRAYRIGQRNDDGPLADFNQLVVHRHGLINVRFR